MTRSCSAGGDEASSSGGTPMKRTKTDGAIFSIAHQAKSAPALTSQSTSELARLPSTATGLAGA